jgi:hypothetical protein
VVGAVFLESIAIQSPDSNQDWYLSSALLQLGLNVGIFVLRNRIDGVLPALYLQKQEAVIHFIVAQTAKVGVKELIMEWMRVMRVSCGTTYACGHCKA